MRLARKNNLELAGIFSDLAEAIEIGQYQVGALVPGGAAREANRKHLRVQMETGFCANHFEQFMLGDEMGGPHVFGRQTEGTSQTEIVLAPSWDVAVEELSKRGASPRARMDAIRDRFDGYLREYLARGFAVLLGHSVDIRAQTQRQLRHVHGSALACRVEQAGDILFRLQNSLHQVGCRCIAQVKKVELPGEHPSQIFHRKTIVASRNGRVRGENALAADFFDVLATNGSAP